MKKIGAAIGAAALALSLGACSSVHHVHHLTEKIQCGSKFVEWKREGNLKVLTNLEKTLAPMAKAVSSGQKGALKKDATSVQHSVKIILHHMPPKCVTGVDVDLTNGLNYVNLSAIAAKHDKLNESGRLLRKAGTSFELVSRDLVKYAKS